MEVTISVPNRCTVRRIGIAHRSGEFLRGFDWIHLSDLRCFPLRPFSEGERGSDLLAREPWAAAFAFGFRPAAIGSLTSYRFNGDKRSSSGAVPDAMVLTRCVQVSCRLHPLALSSGPPTQARRPQASGYCRCRTAWLNKLVGTTLPGARVSSILARELRPASRRMKLMITRVPSQSAGATRFRLRVTGLPVESPAR